MRMRADSHQDIRIIRELCLFTFAFGFLGNFPLNSASLTIEMPSVGFEQD